MYQDKNGWTPLSEGLPDHGQYCFVWYSQGINGEGWCFTKYFEDDGFDSISSVTHWRPSFKSPIKSRKKPCQQ